MKYEILINSVFRLPMQKAAKLLEDYQKNVGFKNFAEQQRVLDILTHKSNAQKRIKEEAYQEAALSLCFMSRDKSAWSKVAFENIKGFPMIIWIEAIGFLEAKDIMSVLNNYYSELPSSLIETCIINLPENMQLTAIDKCNKYIDKDSDLFSNFYYSLSEKAKLKLKGYFPDKIGDDILLELQDLEENEVVERLLNNRERLLKLSSDDLIEFILLKASNLTTLNKFLELFSEKVNECSDSKFKLLFTRYKYLGNRGMSLFDDEDETELLSDSELFKLFKNKFHEIGIEETLSLFDNITHYKSNQFTADVVSEFLDIAYSDIDLSKYINDETILEIITRFVDRCLDKSYSLEDFEKLVNAIGKDGKTKLIFDDYIEAIIVCGKLLKEKTITDKHPLFLQLRDKFTIDLISRCEKDGTYLDNISLNGIFYRLAKGSMPFDRVYMTKTYKGLMYLSKCGQLIDNADYITNFLTDGQLAKLNITPVIRWKNAISRSNTKADNLSFVERMGLQLLCYFGRDKGKYLLESNMQGNRMENLFDGLKYSEISIKDDGTSNINEELINYLFGKGTMKEGNSVINRMIRGEIPQFEKYFTEFCKVKVVTIGKSDYTFKDLKPLEGDVPRPLENNVYVYDSSRQHILAGSMQEEPRYGVVGAQYKDPRKKVVFINEVSDTDIDTLDEIALNINSLRYQINSDETPIDFTNYYKIISGDGWYILFNNDGTIENGVLRGNDETIEEFERYLSRYTDKNGLNSGEPLVKKLKPLTGNKR